MASLLLTLQQCNSYRPICNSSSSQGGDDQNASPFQILRRSVIPLSKYRDFSNFQDGGGPPSWIFNRSEF